MDISFAIIREMFLFIDDILIVTKGTKQNHIDKEREILKTLDEEKLKLLAGKWKIANQEIQWLGFRITSQGISPVNSKVQGITENMRPDDFEGSTIVSRRGKSIQ